MQRTLVFPPLLKRPRTVTVEELSAWIARHDAWVYGLLLLYALAKTGPLPMVAGFVAVSNVLRVELVVALVVFGTVAGAQARFWGGRVGAPWLYRTWPRVAPWVALGAAGVERYGSALLPLYRFSKGTFNLTGLGGGVSRMSWSRFAVLDTVGACLWVGVSVGIGYAIGLLGGALEPEWGAYVGLGLLLAGLLVLFFFGRRLRQQLQPLAEEALKARSADRMRQSMT